MFAEFSNQVCSWMETMNVHQNKISWTATETNDQSVSKENEENLNNTEEKLDAASNIANQIKGVGDWLETGKPKLQQIDAEALIRAKQQPSIAQFEKTTELEAVDNNKSESSTKSSFKDIDKRLIDIETKALSAVTSLGNFFHSALNIAGKTVNNASAKIKESVEHNVLLDFNREQSAFIKTQITNVAAAVPPWVGCINEQPLREECLSLSLNHKNFIRSPPAGADFQFDYPVSYPVAMALLKEDPNLEKMRYKLVPKVISEQKFWENYFYRIHLTCQANELSFMSSEGGSQSDIEIYASDQLLDSEKKELNEFVSDTLQVSHEDLEEVREEMKKLGLDSKNKEDEWERELEDELHDYEMISEQKENSIRCDNLEREIEEILQDETELK